MLKEKTIKQENPSILSVLVQGLEGKVFTDDANREFLFGAIDQDYRDGPIVICYELRNNSHPSESWVKVFPLFSNDLEVAYSVDPKNYKKELFYVHDWLAGS
jgi:hypothetical protein|tara:strand:+ start:140 stop:445 length:306 start_codon:yes stop_codon:yes gene_type:complete